MKVLVTGLCISRNLGGPAMALTLIKELKKRLGNLTFQFAIPALEYEVEKQWADRYGIEIVRHEVFPMMWLEKFKVRKIMHLMGLSKKSFISDNSFWQSVYSEYMLAIRNCDVIINLSGIAYTGDSSYNFLGGLTSYSDFRYAEKNKKPFARFIQTFGPFNNREVRYFARKEFKHLDFIPARGKKSAELCKAITNKPEKVYDFPDIAILLEEANKEWSLTYLKNKNLHPDRYLVISPSVVIYHISQKNAICSGTVYLDAVFQIAENYLVNNPDNKILLLPHMYSHIKRESDRELCYKILEMSRQKKSDSRYEIVEDDIDPMQAKGLIANAQMGVVSRYHALVASLSSGVPTVAIGWNIKYEDILEYYKMNNMAFDARSLSASHIIEKATEKLDSFRNQNCKKFLLEMQNANKQKVSFAFDMLTSWIKKFEK